MKTDQDAVAKSDCLCPETVGMWTSVSVTAAVKMFHSRAGCSASEDRDPATLTHTRAQLRSRRVWSHRLCSFVSRLFFIFVLTEEVPKLNPAVLPMSGVWGITTRARADTERQSPA